MTPATGEYIRRLLIHVPPKGFNRIRHYGLFAKGSCADNIARGRELLAVAKPDGEPLPSPICHQARHLMTASQSRKSRHRARRLSIDHGRARSDIRPASQIVRQLMMSDPIRQPFRHSIRLLHV
jgi:hypothetical protein